MELIIIDSEKLKVMLDKDDMRKYNLSPELELSEEEEERLLSVVLRDAFEAGGFRCGSGSLYVQIFPSLAGGCELFVSRTANREKPQNSSCAGRSRGVINCSEKKAAHRQRADGFVYKFGSLEPTLAALRHLTLAECSCRLFYDGEKDEYYLILEKDSPHAAEFGGKSCSVSTLSYISERCLPVGEGKETFLGELAI